MKRLIFAVLFAGIVLAPGGYLIFNYANAQHNIHVASEIPRTASTKAPPAQAVQSRADPIRHSGLPRSLPVHLTIPAIHVSAPVTAVRQTANGSVGTPPLGEHNLAGWYTKSVTPGETGPSLIDGHVNGYGQNSVFANLRELKKGDTITVSRANGSAVQFQVTWVQVIQKTAFPWDAVLGWTTDPTLRLVTCGGAFDYSTGHYVDNIIVYANPA
jgi:LPXTG-site transpeptidase (sortase) family protein